MRARWSSIGRSVEWPTLALAVLIYGGWGLATLYYRLLPIPLLAVVGGWLVAWHASLQHEIIHDHPTPYRTLNTALGLPSLSLWLPFVLYRRSHTIHHELEHLTDPLRDPESRYLPPAQGGRARLARLVAALQATLLARLILGPFIKIGQFFASEAVLLVRGDRDRLRVWAVHGLCVGAILAWLHFVCAMSLGLYLLCFVYPGAMLSLIRSYAEHRAHPDPMQRTAAVERAPVLGLLFLHNNLHPAHHLRPELAWYRLPAFYRLQREELLRANGGLVYAGYAEVFRRYLLRPHDELMHAAAMAKRRQ